MTTKSFIKTIGEKGLLADYNTEGKKLQTELTAGDNITIDGNTISSDQVFVANYGTTKFAEIKAALNAGKLCVAFKDKRYYYIVYSENTYIWFVSPSGQNTIYSLTLLNSDKWSNYVVSLQKSLTFDTTPTAGSTNPVTSDGIKKELDNKLNVDGSNATGTIPVANGGTGATTPAGAQFNLIDKATTELGPMTDAYRIAIMSIGPSPTNSVISGYRTGLTMWKYMKDKMSSDTGVNISGQAATAGTADKAVADNSGNNIVNTYATKTELNARVPAPTSTTGTQVLKCIDGVIQWVTE